MIIKNFIKFLFGMGMVAFLFLLFSVSTSYAQTADIKINGSDGPVTVGKNEPYVISWSASNVQNCFVSPFISGGFSLSGSFVNTSRSPRTFKFMCTTSAGASVQDTVDLLIGSSFSASPPAYISPPPSSPGGFFVTVIASPSTITRGQNAVLSWNSQGMTSCVASGGSSGWAGPKTLSGSMTVFPETNATYTLTCNNGSQTITRSASIAVQGTISPPPATPSSVTLDMRARNTTLKQSEFFQTVQAQGLDSLRFEIHIKNNGSRVDQLRTSVVLPKELFFVPASTYIDGVAVSDGIQNGGVLLGSLAQGQDIVVAFDAVVYYGVSSGTLFPQTKLSYQGTERIDDANVQIVSRGVVLGAADISTGPANIGLWILAASFVAALLTYFLVYRYRRQVHVARIGMRLALTKTALRIKERGNY